MKVLLNSNDHQKLDVELGVGDDLFTLIYLTDKDEAFPYTFYSKTKGDAMSFWASDRIFNRASLFFGNEKLADALNDKDSSLVTPDIFEKQSSSDNLMGMIANTSCSLLSLLPGTKENRPEYIAQIRDFVDQKLPDWLVEYLSTAAMAFLVAPFKNPSMEPYINRHPIIDSMARSLMDAVKHEGYDVSLMESDSAVNKIKDSYTISIAVDRASDIPIIDIGAEA